MKSRKGLNPGAKVIIETVVAIAAGIIILSVLGPPIQNISPATFLPADLTGGLLKDAAPS
jgi:hypothetical protein